jgi:hypothetical protein
MTADPVMVADKYYCYGHSFLMGVLERAHIGEDDRWEETEEWYNTYKELLEREVGEDD